MLTGLTRFLPESMLSWGDNLEFLLRIVLACGLGALIGLERSIRLKEAGVRTHAIIACGAAIFMILSKYAFADALSTPGTGSADPARIAAQVVSGISFIGAGVIFKQGGSVKGLTTAAGLWATSAVGMAVGAGMYWVSLSATAVIVASQLVMHRFPVGNDSYSRQEIQITMEDREGLYEVFLSLLRARGCQILKSQISRGDGELSLTLTIRTASPFTPEEGMALLRENEGIRSISV